MRLVLSVFLFVLTTAAFSQDLWVGAELEPFWSQPLKGGGRQEGTLGAGVAAFSQLPGEGIRPVVGLRADALASLVVDAGVTVPMVDRSEVWLLGGMGAGIIPWYTDLPMEASVTWHQRFAFAGFSWEVSAGVRERLRGLPGPRLVSITELPLGIGLGF